MPGLQCLAQFQMHAARRPADLDLAAEGEPELGLGLIPHRVQPEAVVVQIVQQRQEILPDEMRQHEAVVQHRAPAHRLALDRRLPATRDDGADQELLRQVHARMRRHLEAAELDQPQPAGGAVGE